MSILSRNQLNQVEIVPTVSGGSVIGGAPTCCISIQCSSCIMSMNTSPQIQIMQLLELLVSALKIQQRIMGSVSAS